MRLNLILPHYPKCINLHPLHIQGIVHGFPFNSFSFDMPFPVESAAGLRHGILNVLFQLIKYLKNRVLLPKGAGSAKVYIHILLTAFLKAKTI